MIEIVIIIMIIIMLIAMVIVIVGSGYPSTYQILTAGSRAQDKSVNSRKQTGFTANHTKLRYCPTNP